MSNILSSLKNQRDRIRASITIKTQNVLFFLALILLITLAIVIRLSPLVEGNTLIKAFDPWIQYYNTEYLSTHSLFDYFHWHDIKSWYPEGYFRGNLRPGLTFTAVIIYQIINSFGIPVSLYDVCFFFPAFMGGASVFAAYLVGKEVLDRKCGLFAAFFLAFNTGFMQRTTAGFFDNETIGVFATLMTFYFFIKAVKTGKITHSILGGMFLGYLSLSWGGMNFVYLILPIVCGIVILMKKYDSNILIAYAGVEGGGLLIYSLFHIFNYGALFSALEIAGIFIFTILLVFFHLINTRKTESPRLYDFIINLLKWGVIPAVVIVAGIIWVAPDLIPFGFGKRLLSILSPLVRENLNIVASVAEHMPSSWSTFYYNTLIPLMLLPLGLFFLFKKLEAPEILLIVFLILIFYFTGSMIRIILLFAPAASLVGAYGLVSVLKIFGSFYGEKAAGISRKRKRQLKRTVGKSEIGAVFFIVGIMCTAQVINAANISITQLSQSQLAPGGQLRDWEESLTWMRENLPGTTVVVSWWDYGYWLTPIGNMTTVNDNGTINSTRIGMTGMAFMQTNEIYSAKVFRDLHADYVLVYFGCLYPNLGGDEGKWPWMLRICNDNYNTYKRWGMEEDNWAPNSVFLESEYWDDATQKPNDKWFESTLVKLMFSGISTAQVTDNPQNFIQYYQQQIYQRTASDGSTYASHIPTDGDYDFKVFLSAYTSTNGLVKLFKVDYTALDSSFKIDDPVIYDSGYGTVKLENTGSKPLTITDVKVNGVSYNYTLGKGVNTNKLAVDDSDLAWIDIKSSGQSFKKNDVVNVTVEAQSVALEDKTYTFSEKTSNFFVEQAKQGDIKINKAKSNVIQVDEDTAEIYLEIENTGQSTVILEDFYLDDQYNILNTKSYLSGSPILEAGQKAYVKIANVSDSFYPIKTYHKIGVKTPNNIVDEILLTSNKEEYKISILDEDRVASSEIAAVINDTFRDKIPVNLDNTYAYTYDNGTTLLNLKLKNTGDIILGLDSIYLTESTSWVSVEDFVPFNLPPGQEKAISIIASDHLTGLEVNDEIGIIITANFDGATKASDIGFIHTVKDDADMQIIENVKGVTGSYVLANETGKVLVKNTGIVPIKLDSLYFNGTAPIVLNTSNVIYEYGNQILDIQESALIAFNTTGLFLNYTNIVEVSITTNTTANFALNLTCGLDSNFYDIEIDDDTTYASTTNGLAIAIKGLGLFNVTVESVYINGTYIGLDNFDEILFEIGALGSITLSMGWAELVAIIGPVSVGDDLEILVRTKEGAEDTHLETVVL